MKYPLHLIQLIDVLKRLPGVGNKSAERYAFEMIDWPAGKLREMAEIISQVPSNLKSCPQCGCLIGIEACPFCQETRAQSKGICIVSSPRDVFAIEQTHEFKGLYHVLGGLLSPIDGLGPDKLNFAKLLERIQKHQIQEVVIALDSTLEGDATALYLKRELEPLHLQIFRLAFGLPMGSSLDYVDGSTLAYALSTRTRF